MPLSDAARALLNRKAGNAPDPEPPPQPPDETHDRGNRPTTFAERAAREEERFRLATDSEYWVALCFRGPDDPARFCRALGVEPAGHYIPGPAFTARATARKSLNPVDKVKQLLAARSTTGTTTDRITAKPAPDPTAGMRYTGDIEADSHTEYAHILAALQAPPDPNPIDVHDSPHWIVVVYPSREDKDAMLADTGLIVLGDKYLDGHQAASILHVNP